MVNKLSLNSGRAKYKILQEFSINDLVELLVYENIEFYSLSKDDVRHMTTSALIACTGGGKHEPEKFRPEWAKEKDSKNAKSELTKEQICSNSKRYWGQWELAQKIQKKNDKIKD